MLGDSLEKCSVSDITQKGHVSPLATVLTAQLICQMQVVWPGQESFQNRYKGDNWKGLGIPQALEFVLGDLNHDQASYVFLEIDGLQCQIYLFNLNKIILDDRYFSTK